MSYRLGIFPWFNPGEPILWWSPDPRRVLLPASFKVSRSLAKRARRDDYQIRVDSAFEAVMSACAAPRPKQGGTWISPPMIAAYGRLHAAGHAHSVEVWDGRKLVGGLYGVSVGIARGAEAVGTHHFIELLCEILVGNRRRDHQVGDPAFGGDGEEASEERAPCRKILLGLFDVPEVQEPQETDRLTPAPRRAKSQARETAASKTAGKAASGLSVDFRGMSFAYADGDADVEGWTLEIILGVTQAVEIVDEAVTAADVQTNVV